MSVFNLLQSHYIVSGKKSLYGIFDVFLTDKLKPIFIIFGMSRPEYSLGYEVKISFLYIAMSLRRADVIMTTLKNTVFTVFDVKKLTLFRLITSTKLNISL